MDRASSLIFPGSRTLAGWWRQLQPFQPQALQVGYGHVHRIEALIQAVRAQPIDAITQLVLQALNLEPAAGDPLAPGVLFDELCRRLCLPAAVLQQILIDIEKNGLIARSSTAGWQATELGRLARDSRQYPVRVAERRGFSFLEQLSATGQRIGQPLFLPIAECVAVSWQVDPTLRFETPWLQACIAQSADWKRLHAFPQEVETLVQNSSVPAWRKVIVDRPERILMVLILAGAASDTEWLGFAVRPDGWELSDQTPILRLSAAARSAGPELSEQPSAQVCQDAWRSWCRQRQLPMNEVESCLLSHEAPRLIVQAPERFVQRLRTAKSDLLKGEAWLLLGEGYLRSAVLLALSH